MWRLKMFGKFIVWLLKKIFKVPLMIIANLHVFLIYWKEQCREEWGMAFLLMLLTTASTTISSLLGILIFVDEADVTKPMLQGAVIHGFYAAAGTFVFVMLLAAYDSFKEEYEQSFNRLKE